jgi:hypothetical protein
MTGSITWVLVGDLHLGVANDWQRLDRLRTIGFHKNGKGW